MDFATDCRRLSGGELINAYNVRAFCDGVVVQACVLFELSSDTRANTTADDAPKRRAIVRVEIVRRCSIVRTRSGGG